MTNPVACPKCGSTQISANKKGFSGAKAVAGAVVAGPFGIAAGTHGSRKIEITCLNCGHVFSPGSKPVQTRTPGKYDRIVLVIAFVCFAATIYLIVTNLMK